MKYSLAKIAEELGVSKATVSLVLNGKAHQARISEELETRIKEFCGKINYVPNIHAQRINSRFAKNFGFLLNQATRVDDDNPFGDYNVSTILGGAVLAAERIGCRISVQLYNKGMDETPVFNWLRNNEIDGIIYYGLDIPEEWKETFAKEKRCIVGIGVAPDKNISSVNTDNFKISHELGEYLIKSGKRNFLYLSGMGFVSNERKGGFLAACGEHGIELSEENIIAADFSETAAENVIFDRDMTGIDAIVCANDDMAIGAMKALKRRGISVPNEISVSGGDNILIGQYFSPSLTTFNNHQHELGEAAVECMARMLRDGAAENAVIPSELIIREST